MTAFKSVYAVLRIPMFDLDQFTADCRAVLKEDASHRLVCEVVARAVSEPSAVLKRQQPTTND
jgi:hypothetical protein